MVGPLRGWRHSVGWVSLTLPPRSDRDQPRAAGATTLAPAAESSASAIPLPCPAPASMSTVCPAAVSSSAPTGKRATRYSSDLISLGNPTIIPSSLSDSDRPGEPASTELTPGSLWAGVVGVYRQNG